MQKKFFGTRDVTSPEPIPKARSLLAFPAYRKDVSTVRREAAWNYDEGWDSVEK